MPKLKELSIILPSNHGPAFFSGQMVQGQLVVDLGEPMKMRGIRLHISGRSDVHWSETRTSGNRKVTTHYRAHEVYINEIIVLYGKDPGQAGDDPVHPAGRHTYPFQFQIPPTAPSSFEGGIGNVRYLLGAVIDKPWKFNHRSVLAITVVNLLDLNQHPDSLLAIDGENFKTLCCLCCESGPITATFKLNRQGYVPGEHVPCFAEIHNNSDKKMSKSYVALQVIRNSTAYTPLSHAAVPFEPRDEKLPPHWPVTFPRSHGYLFTVINFKACGKTRRVERVLQTLRKGEIPPGGTETWNGETIRLPAIPPSMLQGCNIIDIQYFIMLVVVPSGLAFDLIVALEVLIGSIPHWSVAQQYNPQLKPPPSTQMAQPAGGSDAPPIAYPAGMPPPQYEESVGGKVNIRGEEDSEHTRGNAEFSPMYPYYNWGKAYNPDGLAVEGYQPGNNPQELEM